MALPRFGVGIGNPVTTKSMPLWPTLICGSLGTIACAAVAMFIGRFYPPETNTLIAVVLGVLVGGLTGMAIIRRVPLKVQLAGLGAIFGMGLDELVNVAQGNVPQTAIHALARLVKQTVDAVVTDIPPIASPDPVAWALGIWVFFGTVAVILLIGLLPSDVR